MTALDLTEPNMVPCHKPASQAVYAATGHEVRMTMVAGRVVYRDGTFPTIDYPALRREMAEAARWACERRR
jgi:5-methylthioadenosine/S-adenosylhomocysteine deaminase